MHTAPDEFFPFQYEITEEVPYQDTEYYIDNE
jgi:hypothetical protein